MGMNCYEDVTKIFICLLIEWKCLALKKEIEIILCDGGGRNNKEDEHFKNHLNKIQLNLFIFFIRSINCLILEIDLI